MGLIITLISVMRSKRRMLWKNLAQYLAHSRFWMSIIHQHLLFLLSEKHKIIPNEINTGIAAEAGLPNFLTSRKILYLTTKSSARTWVPILAWFSQFPLVPVRLTFLQVWQTTWYLHVVPSPCVNSPAQFCAVTNSPSVWSESYPMFSNPTVFTFKVVSCW